MKEVAVRDGLDHSYVSRMAHLTTPKLAIVAAIQVGTALEHTTLSDLEIEPRLLSNAQWGQISPFKPPS